MSQEVGGALYAQQAEAAGGSEAPAGDGPTAQSSASNDDDAVDAEIVDEDTDKRS